MSQPNDVVMYHSTLPANNADSYGQNAQIEFVIDIPQGRAMKEGTLNIQFDLLVESSDGVRVVGTDEIGYDHLIGGHGIFQSFQSSANSGMIESLQNYPRSVKMYNETQMSRNSVFSGLNQCELLMPNFANTTSVCTGYTIVNTGGTSRTRDFDCNIKPLIALNKTLTPISPMKTGRISLIAILERNNGFLHGNSVVDACKYSISNVELQYISVIDKSKPSDKLTFFTTSSQKNTLQSGRSNITCVVPDMITSLYASFIEQADEFSNIPNNTKTSVIKSIDNIKILANDSQSENVVYEQDTYDEILKNYVETLQESKRNEVNNAILATNNGFGIGQNFSGAGLNLLNNKLDLEITTSGVNGISNTNPYTLFVYFNGILTM
jgi:hypothetical protein